MPRKLIALFTLTMILALALPGIAAASPRATGMDCGKPQVYDLWAGKTIDVGSVTVWNDENNLYVKYDTTGDWWITDLHLYVLDYEPMERLTPGHAPYKLEGALTQSHTFTVPLPQPGECGYTVWLQAHAAVVKKVNGDIIESETAYGGDITDPGQGSWYGNIGYTVQCCEPPPPPPVCYADETAWAAGNRYVAKGNWATFTPYVADSTVTLYAGKTIPVGTVSFSAVADGQVTITIALSGGWSLDDVDEPVKIQGYDVAPSGNPSPGLFTTYKGSDLTITVPAYAFYGIHLDVRIPVECPPM